jgi:hypothetical protein
VTIHEDRERRHIVEYFEIENPDGAPVTRAEKITSERIYGNKHDVWDVEGQNGRWWVITNLTNLYSHEEFPSMHTAFALHIGVLARMMARQSLEAPIPEEEQGPFTAAWRRYEQAAEANDNADEAEDFQAVGVRCRECLLTLIEAVADDALVPEGESPPKRSDFVNWSSHLADAWASGSSSERHRAYLKAASKATWDLVNWLTHARNASRFDGIAALDATSNVLSAFTTARMRFEHGDTDRCPSCGSYQLGDDYDSGSDTSFRVCNRCHWQRAIDPNERMSRSDQ